MTKLSMDKTMIQLSKNLNLMPRSYKGHKFILIVIDEVTKLHDNNFHPSVKVGGDRGCFDRACAQQVQYTQMHDHGPG